MSYTVNLQLIKNARTAHKITVQEMAHALGLKNKSDYSKRENGDTKFKSTEIPMLSNVLGLPIDRFFNQKVDKIETQ